MDKVFTLDVAAATKLEHVVLDGFITPEILTNRAGWALTDWALATREGKIRGACNKCRLSRCATNPHCTKPREFHVSDLVITILAGYGNHAGCGWVAAETLAKAGCQVSIAAPSILSETICPAVKDLIGQIAGSTEDYHFEILWDADCETLESRLDSSDIIIDAMVGASEIQSLFCFPLDRWADLCNCKHEIGVHVLAADIPSGLNAQTGQPSEHCVKADRTLAMIAQKTGVMTSEAAPFVGEVVYDRLDLFVQDYLSLI